MNDGQSGDASAAAAAPQPDEVMFSTAARAEQACRGSRDTNAGRAAAGRLGHALRLSFSFGPSPLASGYYDLS